ncbi:cytochrome P450 [Colletotrichum navitas]|uniref:Cytochrome P450 n=1 Tax=Colletotrichum navitas TaxID=681940 RepID=A0AAD8PJF3_9PEZI|nr:cytochrome P450 [Colletotrichum navitas]KAK1563972.1 cytochrome P450 [Colletotrichum navitas]
MDFLLNLYCVATVIVIATLFRRLFIKPSLYAKYPLWGEHLEGFEKRRTYYVRHAAEVYYDAYKKFKDQICRITTHDGDVLVLPIRYADELLKMPDETVNSSILLESRLESKILGVSPENPYMVHVLRLDLNRQIPHLNAKMADAARHAMLEILGNNEDWKELNVYQACLGIVSIVSSPVFVGSELCHSPEWLDISRRFVADLFHAATALKVYPQFLRPIAKYWCPEVSAVQEHMRKAHDLLKPIIEQRRALRDKDTESEQNDLLRWLVNKAQKWGRDDAEFLVHSQLQVTMASLNNTTAAVVHILYDITGHCPQIIPELRAEIQSALDDHDGAWSTSALFNMKLLDSVMKESLRLNPNLMITPRTLLKPVEFSDGTKLAAGLNVCVAGYAALQDGEFYENPSTFDPYRFLKLRSGEVEDRLHYSSPEQYQYVSVTKENMVFGYGRHACPGRFFANNAVKMICGQILEQYDIKLPHGVTDRYPNRHTGHFINPDTTKTLLFKQRK